MLYPQFFSRREPAVRLVEATGLKFQYIERNYVEMLQLDKVADRLLMQNDKAATRGFLMSTAQLPARFIVELSDCVTITSVTFRPEPNECDLARID